MVPPTRRRRDVYRSRWTRTLALPRIVPSEALTENAAFTTDHEFMSSSVWYGLQDHELSQKKIDAPWRVESQGSRRQ